MCDYDLIEYNQLLQEDSEKIDKELSKLDERFKESHPEVSVDINNTEKLKETA